MADLCIGGSPCTDHSMYGNREQMAGKNAKIFWSWNRLIHDSEIPFTLFENVLGFDIESVQNGFSDSKVVFNIETHPNELGNAIRRPRRKVLLARRNTPGDQMSRSFSQDTVGELYKSIFERNCGYSFEHYFNYVSGNEIGQDMCWAGDRPSVKFRYDPANEDVNAEFADDRGCLACMSIPERRRVEQYNVLVPGLGLS
jgi:hypothetical protein